jgi:predicted membrane protein
MEQKSIGWKIASIVTVILFLCMFAGIWFENIPVIYGTFALLMIMALIARIIRGNKRKRLRLEEEAKASVRNNSISDITKN